MKNLLPALLCAILFSGCAEANYEKGVEARMRGDYAEALNQWMADLDNPRSMTAIGALYDYGQGVPKDYAKAAEWYAKAAEKGEPRAIAQLANFSLNGAGGVQRNPAQWRERLEGLAGEDVYADYVLATFYLNGYGGEKDYEKARSLLDVWVRKGHAQLDPFLRQAERRLADREAGVLEADVLIAEIARSPASFDLSYKDRRIVVGGWVNSVQPLDGRGYAVQLGAQEPADAPEENVLAVFFHPDDADGIAGAEGNSYENSDGNSMGVPQVGDFIKLDGVYVGKHPFSLEDSAFSLFGCSLLEVVSEDRRL